MLKLLINDLRRFPNRPPSISYTVDRRSDPIRSVVIDFGCECCTRQRCALFSYAKLRQYGTWTKVWCLYFDIVVASSSSPSTSYHTTQTRRRRCALLMMASSMFCAERRICKHLSELAVLTGSQGNKTPATQNVWREARVSICNRPLIVW